MLTAEGIFSSKVHWYIVEILGRAIFLIDRFHFKEVQFVLAVIFGKMSLIGRCFLRERERDQIPLHLNHNTEILQLGNDMPLISLQC